MGSRNVQCSILDEWNCTKEGSFNRLVFDVNNVDSWSYCCNKNFGIMGNYSVFIVLLVMFLYVLFKKEFGVEENIREDRIVPVTVSMSTVLGFYDGFLGPGTGNFLIAGYVKEAGFDMKRAAATSKIVTFGGNVGALILFASVGLVNYKVGISFAIVNIGVISSTYALKYGTKLLRPLFLIISFSLISKIGYDILLS